MKAIPSSSLATTTASIVAAAIAISTITGAAQDKAQALISNIEVRQLVARGEPGDSARLSAHFTALADRYAAEARRHSAMAQSFAGNASRNLGTGMSAHCKRLADLNTQSAATVRELAAYHRKLAAGVAATPPPEGARFEGGAGAPEPTEKDLSALAAKAATPAEHRALEEYFLTLAKRYTAEANEHAELAQVHRGTRVAAAAVQHERLAGFSRDAAKEATDAAAMHKALAGIGR
jgi:hypothetical protein